MSTPTNGYQSTSIFLNTENRYEQDLCTICYQEFTPESRMTVAKCNHLFHEQCLGQWQSSNSPGRDQCPICSEVIVGLKSYPPLNWITFDICHLCTAIFSRIPHLSMSAIHAYNG